MATETELVTVFRSADESAQEDADAITELLQGQGFHPVHLDDNAPGVPEMAHEVRVPAEEAAAAEGLIAQASLPADELTNVDDSSALDLVTVFSAEGTTAEIEALSVKGLLEAAGIGAVLVGDSVLPNFPFEVRVASEFAEQARGVIQEAQSTPLPEETTETPSNP